MSIYETLGVGLVEGHPIDSARVLETMSTEEVLEIMSAVPPDAGSKSFQYMAPDRAASVLALLPQERAAPILEHLGPELAANVLRRLDEEQRKALIGAMATESAQSLRRLLRFREGSAGSLMDPNVLALPEDLSAREALEHMRSSPERVRYNLYVVDRSQTLVGVLNLRELLLARGKDLLRSIMHGNVLSLPAWAGSRDIVGHPAWRDARSVPVVDEKGTYLGAVRYQMLRRLEEMSEETGRDESAPTVEALGDLFSTGLAGVFGALAHSVARPFPEGVRSDS